MSKSSKLQDAQWIGQVLSAARSGDAAAMKGLLAQDRAKARLRKLHKPVEVCHRDTFVFFDTLRKHI
jgi:hypothetical protein